MWLETETVPSEWEHEIDIEASVLIDSGTAPMEAVVTAVKALDERRRTEAKQQEGQAATCRHHLHYLP